MHRRAQLTFASGAVLLAAADTYVVVVALPSIMSGVGVGVDQLQRATPIVTGFLLGYVVVLPLLGRLADLVGRRPVLLGCLGAFAAGSLVTATAHALPVLVVGRAVQGLGGGGLVPVTLSMVAAWWPAEQRGLPLGVVGAVQELGSLLGPLYGAVVVAAATWRWIFWLNLPLAALLGASFAAASRPTDRRGRRGRLRGDPLGAALATAGLGLATLGLVAPASLVTSVSVGGWFTPLAAGSSWAELSSPVTVAGGALLAAAAAWELLAPGRVERLVDLRRVPAVLADADLPGAALLGGALACVVVAFATADPSRQVVASSAPVVAPVGVLLVVAFALRQRRARVPLVEPAALRRPAAWGALLVNLGLGAGLMAALVDVPFFARATRYPGSEVGAALELGRFLVAVPVGAVLGGWLSRRASRGPAVATAGAALAAVAFAGMATWSADALSAPLRLGGASLGFGAADVELAACGLGFGLAIAPVNAAVLSSVPARLHGLASALAVVARTVGMLAGLSALTAVGIRRFYEAQARIGSPAVLCPTHPASCPAYDQATLSALVGELHTIFAGAACCAAVAAVLSVLLLRRRRGDASGLGVAEVLAAR